MNSMRRLVIVNVLLLVVLIGGGFAGYYFYNQSVTYLSTDNAKIDGQSVSIAPPTAGKLVDWNGEVGKSYAAGDRVGVVETMNAATGKPMDVDVVAPQNVTIVQQTAVKNSFVGAGLPLAYSFDMDHLWVTANIKETDINDVKTGQEVDIDVDAYPGTTLKGKVEKIGLATANTFSLLPSSNTTGNYTKVTQVLPVTVSLDGYKGLDLAPGMNVTVRIHK
ncbi:HlyD family efflux transporter periplasmic adaptor subunit [Tumebacillus sp. ITR2]|uniref:HlyD family efflux transporter periplasmic adaptor subunit n=1 Tax=Tumebacillus amylolyticus TaxID=2801339 RepID=A0ABS1JG33_9BACL|nr:HlyD family efflux transporter periplasmic adaptor subunit [Tumebacillus amylolyticus]MBL0389190.1 HlyD family efflux transporter periplasmic adaptor subunit [Tumebacillus amylolyticus]